MSSPIVPLAERQPLLRWLEDARSYLECRARRQAPGPHLAHAWECFYQRCAALLRRYARACRVPPADLEDCLQAVWAELVGALPTFRYEPGRGLFRSWLFALVRARAVDLLRRRLRRPTERIRSRTGAALRSREADPAAACERQAEREAVRLLLAEFRHRVSRRNYHVLHMRSVEGRSVGETAAALDLTPEQVRYRHHRMMRKFRSLAGARAG